MGQRVAVPGRGSRYRVMMQNTLVGLALAGLIASPFSVLAQGPPWQYASAAGASASQPRSTEKLAAFQKKLARLRQSIDRSDFDLEALLDSLDYEPANIVRFMQQHIAFEPYAGLLRGPRGTLMSRAGNALDQAVMLAKLINDSGWQARIASTRLTDAQALKLLQQMRPATEPTPLMSQPAFRQSFHDLLAALGLPEDKIAQQMAAVSQQPDISQWPQFKHASKNRDFLLNALKQAGVPLKPQVLTGELRQQVKDYFWVEYRLDEGQPWASAHPVFAGANQAFGNLKKTAVMATSVPEKWQHRVRFSAYLERRKGQRLETERIFGPWEKPASNVYGLSLQYANVPDSMASVKNDFKPEDIASRTHFLLPTFRVANNKPQSGDRLFDLHGRLLDKMAAGSEMAGIMQTVGNKTQGAASALSALGAPGKDKAGKPASPPKRLSEITAQWIEVSLIAPDGHEQTLRRYSLDRLGPERRKSGLSQPPQPMDKADTLWQLASPSQVLISPGRYPDSYVMERYLANLEKILPLLAAKPGELSVQKLADLLNSLHDHRPLQLAASFDTVLKGPLKTPSWRPRPAVLFLHNRYALKKADVQSNPRFTEQRIIDIAEYPEQTVLVTPLGIGSQPQQTALLGTWATRIEQDGQQVLDADTARQLNVDKAFAAAQAQGAGTLVLTKANRNQHAGLLKQLPASSRAAIAEDLRDGYAVVLPDKPVPGVIGWWRVHPKTGETLGRINEGLGGVTAEHVILINAIHIELLLAYASYNNCMRSGTCSHTGCLNSAAVGFLVSLGVMAAGGLIGHIWKGAAVAAGIEIGSRGIGIASLPGMPSPIPDCID
jgi:hypothetical protein